MVKSIPLVSVIIPCYNHEKYIGRCIRSLLNQDINKGDYEIIVIDDGSTDNSSKVLNNFKNDINLIKNDNNCGLPASLNKAIKISRSPFIIRVDSDDYVNSDFISLPLKFLTNNSDIDAIACDYFEVNESEEIIRKVSCDEEPIACGIMFRIEHIIEIGLYDEEFLLYEEIDLRNRFLKNYKIERLHMPLYRYRQHSNNITRNFDAKKKYGILLDQKHGTNKND